MVVPLASCTSPGGESFIWGMALGGWSEKLGQEWGWGSGVEGWRGGGVRGMDGGDVAKHAVMSQVPGPEARTGGKSAEIGKCLRFHCSDCSRGQNRIISGPPTTA